MLIPAVLIALPLVLLLLVGAGLALAPERWLGARVAALVSDGLGVPVRIERLSVAPFSLTPSVDVSALDVAAAPAAADGRAGESSPPLPDGAPSDVRVADAPVSDVAARVALDLPAALRGRLLIDTVALSDGRISLQRFADGSTNVDALLHALGGEPDPQPQSDRPGERPVDNPVPAVRSVSIDSIELMLRDELTGAAADFVLRASGSTIDSGSPLSFSLDGTLARDGEEVPASLTGTAPSLSSAALRPDDPSLDPGATPRDLQLELEATLGSLNATVQARIVDAAGAADIDAELVVAGESLDALQVLTSVELPKVPDYRFQSSVSRRGDELRVQRFDARLGDSVFEGDLRLDSATTPVTLYANLIFTALDLDELLAVAVGEGVESADRDEREGGIISGSSGWFPDRPLGLAGLAGSFDGLVDLRASGIDSRWPLDTLDVSVALQSDRIRIDPVEIGIAGGRVQGRIDIDTANERPEGELELVIERIELVRIVEALGIDDDSAGVLGGQLRYWFTGDSIAAIAASVDGGTFLLMTGGRLDALLTELVGLDLVESVMLLADPGKTLTPIECAYVDVLGASGVLDVERLVVDTLDSVIIVDGTVDLGAQTFDLALQPHAKDASLISAQGPVAISGGDGELSVRPGPDLLARAGLSGLLASVAAPAAALLPLIRIGAGEDSVYCDGLVDQLERQR